MTYPISIDFDAVSRSASDPAVVERATQLRAEWGNPRTVFLGVDRIDYTKGIPERLEAFECLLGTGRVSSDETLMFQAGSPSRENVVAYQDLRERVEKDVRRINREYPSESGRDAVLYKAENLERTEMLALFVAADVMVVSSLRDGMNLVAKEFVACRNDDSGVLILSPFTGAADQMKDAVLADPRDREALAGAMLAAATMNDDEQHKRMRALRQEVREHDVAWWADQILRDLGSLGLPP
jgi:trehalose-6-phosphate synthase